jgi:hypothetical protein
VGYALKHGDINMKMYHDKKDLLEEVLEPGDWVYLQ